MAGSSCPTARIQQLYLVHRNLLAGCAARIWPHRGRCRHGGAGPLRDVLGTSAESPSASGAGVSRKLVGSIADDHSRSSPAPQTQTAVAQIPATRVQASPYPATMGLKVCTAQAPSSPEGCPAKKNALMPAQICAGRSTHASFDRRRVRRYVFVDADYDAIVLTNVNVAAPARKIRLLRKGIASHLVRARSHESTRQLARSRTGLYQIPVGGDQGSGLAKLSCSSTISPWRAERASK